MPKTITEQIEKRFYDYIARFYELNKLPAMQQLKLDHSLRVANNCNEIAKGLFSTPEEIALARIIGLLHDIGRFEQWRRYGTFSDGKSIDHGELGLAVSQQEKIVDLMPYATQQIILKSIQLHNKISIPADISPQELLYLNIIREADRLDIIHIIITAIESGEIQKHPEMIWHASLNGDISKKVLSDFRSNNNINYADLKSMNDWLILHLQWISLLRYQGSIDTVKKQHILERFKKVVPRENLAEMNICILQVLDHLNI